MHYAFFEASKYYEIEFTEDQVFRAYHQGDCEQDANEVSKELGLNIPRSELITGLEYYGAWETEELENKSTEELRSIVTWLLAGYLYEEIE